MRRKSERAAAKTTKASPDKKVEKRTRTRRRKQSSSSEGSAEESSPTREEQLEIETEKKPASASVKEDSPEEAQDQVWQVKTADGAKDSGEIQKLKICLTRPPSTPERADRSPRSKRKHSHATSSSDSVSAEGGEDRRKSRRHRQRSLRGSKDEDINQNSQPGEVQTETVEVKEKAESVVSQSTEIPLNETPVSTTNEETNSEESESGKEANKSEATTETAKDKQTAVDSKGEQSPDADTTVNSPITKQSSSEPNTLHEARERSQSLEKSEFLELHADDTTEIVDSVDQEEDTQTSRNMDRASSKKVSIDGDKPNHSFSERAKIRFSKATNDTDVVDSSEHDRKVSRNRSAEAGIDYNERRSRVSIDYDKDADGDQVMKDLTKSQDEPIHNGQPPPPLVITRKRKWGSRKLTTQKSITISTDVLKEIIPDVKPVEFNEVIEERKEDKKHKRHDVADKVMRPVLPKIVIDNSENVVKHMKEEDDVEHTKTELFSANRRISIMKENDSIITRPPSPPRYKSSDILFISNLTRPFTLPQLKNLLQRTGRIVQNGFWIDKIKSKCFVQYENEDQAVETRHALHGVTWPVSNPKALQVDFSTPEAFEKARLREDIDNAQASTIPGTVEDWMREQDEKRERGELEKPWERKLATREWDMGKGNEKDMDKDKLRRDERHGFEKRRQHIEERSPEPEKKFKRKEEEAPAKLLDDLFRKTKTSPCIYWLPLSAETIAIKEEQRRQHMAEHERRLLEQRRPAAGHRRH